MRCALCGNEIEAEPFRFSVSRLTKGAKPEPIALTRPVCTTCAFPDQQTSFVTTLRRIPSILDSE